MLTLNTVRKRFGSLTAVDGLSLTARRGEILGLLGPNGAGKSTTVAMAVGVLAPDSGRVVVEGHGDPRQPAVRARLGVAPQALAVYDLLSGEENLRFFGEIYGLHGAGLCGARRLGAGLRRPRRARPRPRRHLLGRHEARLNIAAALVHDPELILLDEPTVGVDPQSRNAIFDNIAALRRDGHTVVYTTHYMEEAERLCDRIAIVDRGRLLAIGTLGELLAAHGATPILVVRTEDGERRLPAVDPLAALNAVAATTRVLDFHVERPTLEQVFLRLTGRTLRD